MCIDIIRTCQDSNPNYRCLVGSIVSDGEYPFEEEFTPEQMVDELKNMYEDLVTRYKPEKNSINELRWENDQLKKKTARLEIEVHELLSQLNVF